MSYEQAYLTVKSYAGNYSVLQPDFASTAADPAALAALREVCEMVLVRVYDDWYVGSPEKNISQAIHRYAASLESADARPSLQLSRVAAVLAWIYGRTDADTSDGFRLLEAVCRHLPTRTPDRFLPADVRAELITTLEYWREVRGLPASLEALDAAERAVWNEIVAWEHAPRTVFTPVKEFVERTADQVGDAVPDSAKVAIADALRGVLLALQDGSGALTRETALLDELRAAGHPVTGVDDILGVPLAVLDRVSRSSLLGGKLLAAAEGAGGGMVGLPGIPVEIAALITTNLRFIQQIALTYGFRTHEPGEREFVLHLLGYSSAGQAAKVGFLREMNRISVGLAKRATWKQLEQQGSVQLLQRIAKELGVRLTKGKLGQAVPMIGGVVGAGVNYGYTHDNLLAAHMFYRKRYLLRKCLAAGA